MSLGVGAVGEVGAVEAIGELGRDRGWWRAGMAVSLAVWLSAQLDWSQHGRKKVIVQ